MQRSVDQLQEQDQAVLGADSPRGLGRGIAPEPAALGAVPGDLPGEERLRRLFRHLGIGRAHVAGNGAEDAALAAAHPEVVASLTLVCPVSFPVAPQRALASRMLVVHGDRGPKARVAPGALAALPGATDVVLRDYPDTLWSDPVAERPADTGPAVLAFLADVAQRVAVEPLDVAHADEEGMVAGITYRVQGSGPPVVLLPLALAASQWDPLLPALNACYSTISLGGAHLWPMTRLEQRARGGYGAVVRTLVDELALRPGERILEVGCGSGAIVRWLARHTSGANPIVGVDVNRYLLREAAGLARAEGVAERLTLQEGNAEALPLPADGFDVTVSCTVLEEGDADRMLAELIRVTLPGGRVGVIVRAEDVRGWNGVPLRPELRAKIESGPGAGAAEGGCADASLYRRFRAAGLAELRMGPQLAINHPDPNDASLRRSFESGPLPRLSTAEAQEWQAAVVQAEAAGTLMWTSQYHCAVGTKR